MRLHLSPWPIAALTVACLGFAGVTHADTAVPLLHRLAGSASGERGSADGVADAARFNYPSGISLSADASVALVADAQNNIIRRVDVATGSVTTIAGTAGQRGWNDGTGPDAQFAYPSGVALAADASFALVADADNRIIRRVDVISGTVTTVAGTPGAAGSADGVGAAARFASPSAIVLAADASFALVADTDNHAIRRIDLTSGAVTTVAGSPGTSGSADGVGAAARFSSPRGVALAADASFALVADSDNHTIRRIDLASGAVTTVAGTAGQPGSTDGTAALFNFPRGIAIAPDGAALIADFSNSTIRRVDLASGAVSTLFGTAGLPGSADGAGNSALLRFPAGVAAAGERILIADTYNHSLRGNGGSITVSPQVYLPIVAR
ncbi:hypothetical protein F8S13_15100 [Chloroflexia bacterium SDU3-3]|nr:hypothetical protein F8S13_15100 [Chloroflexia bacterium SDU3-3]